MTVNNIVFPVTNYRLTVEHYQKDYDFQGNIYTEFQPIYNFLGIEFENLTYYIDHDDLVKAGNKNPNDSSLVLRFQMFNKTVLFTGDADLVEANLTDQIILKKLQEKPIDVFILPHHGSRVSAVEPMLDVIGQDLKYAFISGTLATEE
jgi:hypothetical protein